MRSSSQAEKLDGMQADQVGCSVLLNQCQGPFLYLLCYRDLKVGRVTLYRTSTN